jgi:septum formation protein
MTHPVTRRIVLASSSRYRQEQLARLHLPFVIEVPAIDESALPTEAQRATAERLAIAKARAVAQHQADAIVIGADQVAELDGRSIGKPGTHEAALQQLLAMRGRTVHFHSGIALVDSRDGRCLSASVATEVRFRDLPSEALEAYLRIDLPYDCAGSAKIESLGICLVQAVHSEDPTALVGLPLITLTSMLDQLGVALPAR